MEANGLELSVAIEVSSLPLLPVTRLSIVFK